jgi:hypothetical protein
MSVIGVAPNIGLPSMGGLRFPLEDTVKLYVVAHPFVIMAIMVMGVFGVIVPVLEFVRGGATDGILDESVAERGLSGEVDALLRRSWSDVELCYDRAGVKQEGSSSRIVLLLTISPDGDVTAYKVLEAADRNGPLLRCVGNIVHSWCFTPSIETRTTRLEIDPSRRAYRAFE